MITWESYSAMCIERKIENPYKDEQEFNRAYGIDSAPAPLIIRPKHKSSIDDHLHVVNQIRERRSRRGREKAETAKKPKAPKIPKAKKPKEPKIPKQPKRRKSDEEIAATKKARLEREYERRKLKRMERRIAKGLSPVKTNLKAMSDEEREAHVKALRKAQRERETAKLKSDPEFRAKKKERDKQYQRKYTQKNRGRAQRWAKSNPERIKEIGRVWREKNREKIRAAAKARREKKKAEDPNFLINERAKAKALRAKKRNAANVSWSAESGCAA